MRRKKSTGAEAAWRARLGRFQRSNRTVTEFCEREGVSIPSFYQWRKRLGLGGGAQANGGRDGDTLEQPRRAAAFVPVTVAASVVAEIELPNGIKIRVPAANAELLRAAIAAGCQAYEEAPTC